jgi:hypothetical protein
VAKLSVDGIFQSTGGLLYPRSTVAQVSVRFGSTSNVSLSTAQAASPQYTPQFLTSTSSFLLDSSVMLSPRSRSNSQSEEFEPSIVHEERTKFEGPNNYAASAMGEVPDFMPTSNREGVDVLWKLGNVHFFDDVAADPEILLLYMLGPNYCGNLDVDMSLFFVYDIIKEKTLRILTEGAFGSHNSKGNENADSPEPTTVTKPYGQEDIGPSGIKNSLTTNLALFLDPASYNATMSRLNDRIMWLFSSRNMVIAQSFKIDGFGSARAPLQQHANSVSIEIGNPAGTSTSAASTASTSASVHQVPGGGGSPVGNVKPSKSKNSKLLLANAVYPNEAVERRKRLGVQDIIFDMGGLANVIWFMTQLPTQGSVVKSLKESFMAIADEERATLTAKQKIMIKEAIEKQRQSIRLIHALLAYNARNVKEMKDINGYQLIARIIQKRHWNLDEHLLALLFHLVGIRKTRTVPNLTSTTQMLSAQTAAARQKVFIFVSPHFLETN